MVTLVLLLAEIGSLFFFGWMVLELFIEARRGFRRWRTRRYQRQFDLEYQKAREQREWRRAF